MGAEHTKRRKAILAELAGRKLDCLLVTHPANWYYLTGFTGESGALIISRAGSTLVTDGRFTVQAKEETSGIRVVKQEVSLMASVSKWLHDHVRGKIGFDASQITVEQFRTLRR